jgi:hypothetical protein
VKSRPGPAPSAAYLRVCDTPDQRAVHRRPLRLVNRRGVPVTEMLVIRGLELDRVTPVGADGERVEPKARHRAQHPVLHVPFVLEEQNPVAHREALQAP